MALAHAVRTIDTNKTHQIYINEMEDQFKMCIKSNFIDDDKKKSARLSLQP